MVIAKKKERNPIQFSKLVQEVKPIRCHGMSTVKKWCSAQFCKRSIFEKRSLVELHTSFYWPVLRSVTCMYNFPFWYCLWLYNWPIQMEVLWCMSLTPTEGRGWQCSISKALATQDGPYSAIATKGRIQLPWIIENRGPFTFWFVRSVTLDWNRPFIWCAKVLWVGDCC